MTEWAQTYGPIYQFHLFGKRCVGVADPSLLKTVLNTEMSKFHKDRDFTYRPFMSLLGTGLVTSEGPLWRRQRSLVSAAFRIHILEEVAHMSRRAVARLSKKLEKIRGTRESIEIGEEFRHLTLQVISEALMSLPPGESDTTFASLYLPIVTEGHLRIWYPYREYLPTPAWFSYISNVKKLNAYITSIIEKRYELIQEEKGSGKPSSRRQDILDRVIGAIPEGEWGQAAVKQLRDELKTFVLAGHETSAAMLTWALHELILDQDKMQRVEEEAKATFGSLPLDQSPDDSEIFKKLEYTTGCLKEALRKYSVVPTVVRNASEDRVLAGEGEQKYFIPAGTSIMIGIQAVHHRADLWPEPNKYQPERFLAKANKDGSPAISPYTFLAFIEGPRQCLGQNLSLLEGKIVLSTLVQNFKFKVKEGAADVTKHPWMVPVIPENGLEIQVF
uniref:Cytochrome P450 n=1 Tax=Fibrocapsa japonica TaxID=94617 RepID=A0A7S2Y0F8_9STRA|mmetsp:Transcript_19059/g.27499  ORF Transcript_19059/g.27499 Transcript_19059/m.27499 type:complete len:445 (+) Transcript_19059:2-1336(+)